MKSKIVLSLITSIVLVINQFFSYSVYAEEYSITGNGDGSSNTVEAQKSNSTDVHQNNDAQIENEIKADSNTGGNEANNNSYESKVETGNVNTEVTAENSGNTNQAQTGCCPGGSSSAAITDNGTDSSSKINNSQNNSTSIDQNNKAKVTNNIQITASTGDNEASDNSGDVSIKTGDVNIYAGMNNTLNSSYIASSKATPESNLKISGNGAGSNNEVNNSFTDNTQFLVNNYLQLENNILTFGNTGGNKASFSSNKANNNKGKMLISTGNIYLDIILSNKINISKAVENCGCKSLTPSPTPTPSESPSPSSPPSGGGGNNGGSSGGGGSSGSSSGGSSSNSSDGQVLGATLPATGGFSIWQATIFALALLLIGIMLRIDYAKAKDYFQSLNYNFIAPVVIYLFANFKGLSYSDKAQFARRHSYYLYP